MDLNDAFAALGSDEPPDLRGNLAAFYDRLWAAAFNDYDEQAAIVRSAAPDDATAVLGCACGTARTLARIEGEFDDATGIDLGVGLVEIAGDRVERATVERADMTDFRTDSPVDLVYALGYCMGALSVEAVGEFAAASHANLRPGGWLVVDVLADQAEDGAVDDIRAEGVEGYDLDLTTVSVVQGGSERFACAYGMEDRETGERRQGGELHNWHQHEPAVIRDQFAGAGFDATVRRAGENVFGERAVVVGRR